MDIFSELGHQLKADFTDREELRDKGWFDRFEEECLVLFIFAERIELKPVYLLFFLVAECYESEKHLDDNTNLPETFLH